MDQGKQKLTSIPFVRDVSSDYAYLEKELTSADKALITLLRGVCSAVFKAAVNPEKASLSRVCVHKVKQALRREFGKALDDDEFDFLAKQVLTFEHRG